MKFTLWVWGSEFADCGWVDREEIYSGVNRRPSFENPAALDFFSKYYDIYAELADCCDRVIGHYYDPGNLHSAEEIAYYAKMLKNSPRIHLKFIFLLYNIIIKMVHSFL